MFTTLTIRMTGSPKTPLQKFIDMNGLRSSVLIRACGRTYGYLLRVGRHQPSLAMAITVVDVLSKAVGRPVGIAEVFKMKGRSRRTASRT
jgi:hypothetical protein